MCRAIGFLAVALAVAVGDDIQTILIDGDEASIYLYLDSGHSSLSYDSIIACPSTLIPYFTETRQSGREA